ASGAELLRLTYMGAACGGAPASASLAVAFRRRPLAEVATRVLAGLSVVLLAAWWMLGRSGTEWVSFALLVLVPIVVPVGFIFVVGQAGLLLDVRTLKALYARVVAGFALGVVSGGLAAPPLLDALGGTEDLVATAAAATALLLALVVTARRRYPNELSAIEHDAVASERPTLRTLTRNRYVMLIVAFQMLSAIESQWLDFLVFDRAAQRYTDSTELARFVSQFSALAYGVDIAFLLLLAGLLLRRFGLRYGLTANSLGVLTVLGGIVVATTLRGSGATIVFALVVAARVVDLTLADGASRTSLSAAYQAVPNHLRAVSQATVEGLAVPVAIGVSGVVLLLVDAVGFTDSLLLPVLTGVVVLAWVAVAMVLYRSYGANLLASLRGRTLDPAMLTVDDESNLVVIDRLVESEDERDVRLGLDILAVAQHPALQLRLEQLAVDGRVNVRKDVLDRLRLLAPHLAAEAARTGLADPSPDVRAASVRVLGAAGAPSDAVTVAALADDPAPEVRVAVAFALPRVDSDDGAARIGSEIARLAGSRVTDDRVLAARMLRECDPELGMDRGALGALLTDADADVVEAALAAVRWPEDADRLPEAAHHIHDRCTAEAAIDVLVRAGEDALPVVAEGLSATELDRRVQELFVRVARDIGGPSAVAVLRDHIYHRDPDIGLAVMRALASLGSAASGSSADPDPREIAVVSHDVEHAAHVLRALLAFADEPSAALLQGALRDELDLLRRRVIAALSMRHGTEGLNRVAFQLAQRDARSHALAIEWLDVTLTSVERSVVALLEPNLSTRERLRRLNRTHPLEDLGTRALLLELVRDDDGRWRPWIKACALDATTAMPSDDLVLFGEVAAASTPLIGPEATVLHETVAGLRARQLDLV
ncbi:MAG: hypothetical protein ABWZ52_00865, partial [Acidimicrobiales bacterium]